MINSGEKNKCLLNFERSHGMEEGSKVLTSLAQFQNNNIYFLTVKGDFIDATVAVGNLIA